MLGSRDRERPAPARLYGVPPFLRAACLGDAPGGNATGSPARLCGASLRLDGNSVALPPRCPPAGRLDRVRGAPLVEPLFLDLFLNTEQSSVGLTRDRTCQARGLTLNSGSRFTRRA